MNAYLPNGVPIVFTLAGFLLLSLAGGFALTHLRTAPLARLASWLLVLGTVLGIERLTEAQAPGFRMLAIIGVLLFSMKAVVAVESQLAGKPRLKLAAWCVFAGFWFGMRPSVFAGVPGAALKGAGALVWLGLRRCLLGLAFVACARLLWIQTVLDLDDTTRRVLATACLLPGLSLMLHFGAFNMIAGFWRRFGANCRPLFRAPLLSKSLTEFWGERWNLAFSEMTALAVYRPLRSRVGNTPATMIAFLFSGLLHELAISVPVKAGYGLPLLYFAIHALGILIELQLKKSGNDFLQTVWIGRLWTIAWLVIPLPMLFHPPFLQGCVWPLIGMETR